MAAACMSEPVCRGELRRRDLAPLLFNERLRRRQVRVQPFFHQLSSGRAGRLALPPTAIITVH